MSEPDNQYLPCVDCGRNFKKGRPGFYSCMACVREGLRTPAIQYIGEEPDKEADCHPQD